MGEKEFRNIIKSKYLEECVNKDKGAEWLDNHSFPINLLLCLSFEEIAQAKLERTRDIIINLDDCEHKMASETIKFIYKEELQEGDEE